MKERDFLRHLERFGCLLVFHEKSHSAYWNPANRRVSAVPRRVEIEDSLSARICGELGIPERFPDFAHPHRLPKAPDSGLDAIPVKGITPLHGYRIILRSYRTAEMEDSFE